MEESWIKDLFSEIATVTKIGTEELQFIARHVLAQMIDDATVGIYQYSNDTDSTSSLLEVSLDETLADAVNSYVFSTST
ncbi:hypothetical protein ACVFVO_09595 [Advenella kashmirensis]